MHKLHPRAIWLFFIRRLLKLGIVPVILVFYSVYNIPTEGRLSDAFYSIIFTSIIINIVIILWIIVSYIWALAAYNCYGYKLGDNSFQKKIGVIRRKHTNIPYEIIEHVDIEQNLLSRLLGLTEVHIEIKGKIHRKSEGYVPGLSGKAAEDLKNGLIKRTHDVRGR